MKISLSTACGESHGRLVGGVKVVEDYFSLAAGNVHCIVGRMA